MAPAPSLQLPPLPRSSHATDANACYLINWIPRWCTGAQLGVVVGYIVTGYMTDALGWESSFYFFG